LIQFYLKTYNLRDILKTVAFYDRDGLTI